MWVNVNEGFFSATLMYLALTRVMNILDLFLIITYPKHVVYTMTNSNRCKICMPQTQTRKRHKKKKGRI